MTLMDKRSEADSKLYIRAVDDIEVIEVDHGLIPDSRQGQKKSDFLIYAYNAGKTHVIELKGKNIDQAFGQLEGTIRALDEGSDTRMLVNGRKVLDAYIVSPGSQKVPDVPSTAEKRLAKLLFARSMEKHKDMFKLIHFVKVVSSQKCLSIKDRKILTSSRAPVEFGD